VEYGVHLHRGNIACLFGAKGKTSDFRPGINTWQYLYIMIVLPYYVQRHTEQKGAYRIFLLLENGGKSSLDIPDISDFMTENQIVPKGPSWKEDNVNFVPIDISKTDMNGFYTWTELEYNDKRECLRSFIKIPGFILSNDIHGFDTYLEAILRHVNKYI